MSTRAAARQSTLANGLTPPALWMQSIISGNSELRKLDGASFQIENQVTGPVGRLTEFTGHAKPENEPPIQFTGYFDSGQVVSFSLTFHGELYTFFGVFSPTGAAFTHMGGIIIGGDVGSASRVAEDEGSWSAQAPPRDRP